MTEMFVPGEKAMLKGKGRDTMVYVALGFLTLGLAMLVALM